MKGATLRSVRRQRAGTVERLDDAIAAEVPVALAYNGAAFAVMMATPDDLEDFALGFSLAEGIVETLDEIRIDAMAERLDGIAIEMRIPEPRAQALAARRRSLAGYSGCGICGSAEIEAVLRPSPPVRSTIDIDTATLHRALHELTQRQPLNARTGATHAAGWANAGGELHLVREDVGRHNALDKLIGAMVRAGIGPDSGFAVVSSRASYELVQKAAQVGIGLLAAISAPTALAIDLAERAGLTLIGFARDDGQAVYSHPHRLRGAAPD